MARLTVEGSGQPVRKAAGPMQSWAGVVFSFSFDSNKPGSLVCSWKKILGEVVTELGEWLDSASRCLNPRESCDPSGLFLGVQGFRSPHLRTLRNM